MNDAQLPRTTALIGLNWRTRIELFDEKSANSFFRSVRPGREIHRVVDRVTPTSIGSGLISQESCILLHNF